MRHWTHLQSRLEEWASITQHILYILSRAINAQLLASDM